MASAQEIETGTLPLTWRTGGPNCLEQPPWEIHEYNPSFYILRESGCTHYEKPFLYLIIGNEWALLVDTGAGESDAAVVVRRLMQQKKLTVPLIVAHSHGHGDHVAGDKAFANQPDVTLIPATVEAEAQAFHIVNNQGSVDLGGRVIDILAIPGHQPAHLAYYDARTGILLTGDHLYPGRLYIADFPTYLASTKRLVQFTEGKRVTHILGCHIEQSRTPYVDYKTGTKYQPDEHSLELGRSQLLELLDGLEKQAGQQPKQVPYRDFTIYPKR